MVVAVVGDSVLIGFQTVFKNVFRYFSEIEVKVAAVEVVLLHEGVHEPEFDILDVRLLEVGVVHLAHDAAPALFGVEKVARVVDIGGVEIVRAALGGIEREVQGLYRRRFAVGQLAAGEHFAGLDFAHVGVRQLFDVAADIARAERRVTVGEHPVNEIPVQKGAVLAVVDVVAERGFGKEGIGGRIVGGRGEEPRIGRPQVDGALRCLEVVDIAAALVGTRLLFVGNELGELAAHAQGRRCCGVDGRNLVQKICQPHEVGVVVEVDAPDGVVDGLVADVDLLGQSFLAEVHDGGADVEPFRELVVDVESEKRFPLCREHRLVFESDVDALSRVDYRLVGDGHYAHGVVDRIVAVFGQHDASGGDDDRSARNVHGFEAYLRSVAGLIFAGEDEFVLCSELASYYEGAVVKFLIAVLLGQKGVVDLTG